jgi:hypothetical protein
MSVRFNLDNQADRRAWDYLQSVSGSRNKAVIDALCAYGDNSTITEIVRSTIRECLQDVTVSPAEPALQITEDESDLLDSLDAFLG